MKDKIVEKVVEKYHQRSQIGIQKYNATMERNDLTLLQWINHLQEELLDASVYIEKVLQELKNNEHKRT